MTQWQRIDGSLLAMDAAARREELVEYFTRHNIPAVLDFHPNAPYLVGLRVYANDDGRVATASAGTLVPGLEVEELAEDIAEHFSVDVLLGDITVEEDEEFAGETAADHEHGEACGCEDDANAGGMRVVTITSAAPEYFPTLARSLGEPILVAPAGEHNHVVLTEAGGAFPGISGYDDEPLPIVQLIADGEDRSVFAHTEDFVPATLTWGTQRVVVAGTPEPNAEQQEYVAGLASDDDDAQAIASASATADVAAVRDALAARSVDGPRLLLEALGMGPEIAEFLEGTRPAADVPGVRTVEPAKPVDLLKSSLGAAVDDVSELRLVEYAGEFERRQPVVARSISAAQAVAGAAVILRAVRGRAPWRAAGITTGVFLVVDGLGELALYEWLRRRRANGSSAED